MKWVPVALAALDQRGATGTIEGVDLLVLPVLASEPIGLADEYAEFWYRLVEGPLADEDLTIAERELVREYAAHGIASCHLDHHARVDKVDPPWLELPAQELVYGMIGGIAAQQGIQLVFIKGPTLERQQLRSPRPSGDVDVWVDPERIHELAGQLTSWGWTHLDDHWEHSPLYHSVTMVPGDWGFEIDLHRHVPGFTAPDRELFGLLVERSETLGFASVPLRVADPGAHAVILALHLMRPQQGKAIADGNQTKAVDALVAGGEPALAFAVTSGAVAALYDELCRAFPTSALDAQGEARDVPLNWKWRAEPVWTRRYRLMFRGSPLRVWPTMIYRSIWPSELMALRIDAMYGGSAASPVRARFRRIKRGLTEAWVAAVRTR